MYDVVVLYTCRTQPRDWGDCLIILFKIENNFKNIVFTLNKTKKNIQAVHYVTYYYVWPLPALGTAYSENKLRGRVRAGAYLITNINYKLKCHTIYLYIYCYKNKKCFRITANPNRPVYPRRPGLDYYTIYTDAVGTFT